MDAVKSFNQELSALYDVKPPISKAKMSALTRGAIKAIKFYKHVVQSVEKFIQKCKPEYKVPGLYVIDSIVRQSRHQFGIEKDVFAPRFTKNIQHTFVNLFKCPPEDKSKIIRVLNLWLKNQVFPNEVISPLFDLADPNNPIHKEVEASQAAQQAQQSNGVNNNTPVPVPAAVKGSPALQKTPTRANPPSEAQHGSTPNLNIAEPVIQQLQQLQRLLTKSSDASRPTEAQVHFDKKLLDYDYGDDEDEVNPSPRPPPQNMADPVATVTNILTNPEILRQLQTLQTTLTGVSQQPPDDPDKMKKLQEMRIQEEEFDRHLAQTVPNLPFASECEFRLNSGTTTAQFFNPPPPEENGGQPIYTKPMEFDLTHDYSAAENRPQDIEVITLDHDDSRSDEERRSNRGRRRSRSRSRDRGRSDRDKRARRSRSRSKSRRHRSRTRSRDRKKKDEKEKERDLEKEKERKRRGLPAIKRDCLSVCSTTLWVGHLSKLVHQDDLSNTFGEYGEIISIDLIPPRGCAFIVMNRRQDAARCLAKLKNYNLSGKAITLAWAPGKGVKGKDFKDYWEGDLGVSYIPYSKIKQDIDLELLEDGGSIDEDTMPQWMKEKLEKVHPPPFLMGEPSNQSGIDTSQPPPMPPPPGGGLLQPPMMPPVSPFMFNNRLMGMMPPNMTMGVPPPNMPPPMMPPQSILGLAGSPFQGGGGMMPPRMPGMDNKINPPPNSLSETLLSLAQNSLGVLGLQPPLPSNIPLTNQPPPPFGHQQEEMDVEMEDVDHRQNLSVPPPLQNSEKYMSLSEQLAASMNQHRDRDGRREDRDDRRGDRRDDGGRGRKGSGSRDRERNRDRFNRERSARGGSRDRDRRDRDRGGDRGDFRGRDRDRRDNNNRDNNRWGGDRRDQNPMERRDQNPTDRRDPNPTDRKEREKTLNDRLREMAGMPAEENKQQGGRNERSSERDKDRRRSRSRDRKSRDRATSRDDREKEKQSRFGHVEDEDLRKPPHKEEGEEANLKEEVKNEHNQEKKIEDVHNIEGHSTDKPPSLLDMPTQEANKMDNPFEGPPLTFEPPQDNFGRHEGPPMDFAGPPVFEGPPEGMGLPMEFGRPNRGPGFDGPPDRFDGPPDRFDGPPDRFDGPPDRFDGPPDRFGRSRGRGRFNRRGGFDGPPRDFNGPPRDFDGPPRDFDGPPRNFDGPPRNFDGPPRDFDGPPRDFDGPPIDFDGPPRNFDGPPRHFDGPPFDGPPFERPPFDSGAMFDGPPMDFDGPPARFGRGGRNRRGRGREDFFPPGEDFGPRPLLGMDGPDFGPRGMMMEPRGNRGGFFGGRGPRGGRGGGFPSRYDGPPDFFRGGGHRGGGGRMPYDNFRGGRGRGRGRGNRFEGPAFDGPPFDGPPFDRPPFDEPPFDGPHFDGPPFDGPQFDGPPFDGPPFNRPPFDRPPFDGPPGMERGPPFADDGDRARRDGKRSRWGGEEAAFQDAPQPAGEAPVEGNCTPLRDEAPNQEPSHDFHEPQRHNDETQPFNGPQGPPEHFDEPQGRPERFDEPQGSSERFDEPQGSSERFDEPQGPSERFDEPQGPSEGFDEPQGSTEQPSQAGGPQEGGDGTEPPGE